MRTQLGVRLEPKISGDPEISFAALIFQCHQWAARLMSLMCSASAAIRFLILGISSEINCHTILLNWNLFVGFFAQRHVSKKISNKYC